jgi:hypothetical protein
VSPKFGDGFRYSVRPNEIRAEIAARDAVPKGGALFATPRVERMPRALPFVFLFATSSLFLACGDNDRASGEVTIATSFAPGNNCPTISWAVAAPAQTSVGGSIGVAASASDPDPGDVLHYSWTPADAFANPGLPTTTYLCSSAGPKTLRLEVSDQQRPSPCVSTATLRITCVTARSGPAL